MRMFIDEYRNEIIHEDEQLNSPISPLQRQNCLVQDKESKELRSPKRRAPEPFLRLETMLEEPAPRH